MWVRSAGSFRSRSRRFPLPSPVGLNGVIRHRASSIEAGVGFALLAAISGLALLEHWLMVLPLPDAKLWRWMLPAPKSSNDTTRPEGHHGF
ncbi:DUF3623 family protein [Roseovarius gaetbuli]|uniref:DUF3623 family protein n=1 Tax=Roseovarius gaetbuli TaxID=1356575 RepID=UPI002795D6E4|nr:DUF3623 family protein [Roseovarius gaetbuli]